MRKEITKHYNEEEDEEEEAEKVAGRRDHLHLILRKASFPTLLQSSSA